MRTKAFSADISIAPGERAVIARISTVAVDRDGDVLQPGGMDARSYELNSVVMYAHDYEQLPVGKVVSLKVDAKAVTAKIVFASRPASLPASEPFLPDTLFSLYQQGVMRGWSVGFTVASERPATNRDRDTYGPGARRIVTGWTLIELSAVSIPANQEAVALAVGKRHRYAGTPAPAHRYKSVTPDHPARVAERYRNLRQHESELAREVDNYFNGGGKGHCQAKSVLGSVRDHMRELRETYPESFPSWGGTPAPKRPKSSPAPKHYVYRI